jgi:hypothetical protein
LYDDKQVVDGMWLLTTVGVYGGEMKGLFVRPSLVRPTYMTTDKSLRNYGR